MNALRAASPSTSTRRFLVPLALTLITCIATTTAGAQGSVNASLVRNYNAQVLQLQSEARRTTTTSQSGSRAAQVLATRAAALRELMAVDPTAAEKLAFPATVLEQLSSTFPSQAASLEQRGRWSGELEYTIEDGADLKSHRSIYRLHRGSEVLELRFSGAEPPGLASGRKVSVGGVRSGRLVVATELELGDAAQDGTTGTDLAATSTYPATCAAKGPQSVLSVLVNLPGYSLPASATPDFVRGVLLGNAYAGSATSTPDRSVDDFWQQNSDGATFVDPANTTVIGPIALSSNFNTDSTGAAYCDYNNLGAAVIKAVDGQVDFRRYSRIQVVMPNNGACGWAGVANVGCRTLSSSGDGTFTASMAWQMMSSMGSRGSGVQLGTHEMGHNLGLSHAASRDFGAEALGALGGGTLSEYGDVHSTMGSWNYGFYAASHAANQLAWLAPSSNYAVVEAGGTYTIQNYEGRPAGLKALKVRRGTGNDAWLWIEGRQNTGLYSSTLNSTLFGGALIHYQDSTTGGKSHLVDFTPATSSFSDSALPLGQTWTDPYSNVSVTVTGVTQTALTVSVNYGALPCVKSAPTLTASPTATATEYGSSALFNVSVKNNSSSGCASETVNLSATVPSGWSKNLAASALLLAPGQTAQTTLTVGVPAPYALGTYSIVAAASAPSGGASSTESVTVIEPTNRLSLGLSGTGSVKFSTPAKTCSSSCVADYPASTATVVTLTATAGSRSTFAGWSGACTGTASTCTVTVGSDQSVSASFVRSGSTGGKGGKPPK